MTDKRIIVCGGRRYANRSFVFAALDVVLTHYGPSMVVVHGAATGADDLASQWCRERGITEERHPADWAAYDRAAGPIRNAEMAEAGALMCVAFPGTNGTESMIREATRCDIRVLRMTTED